MSAGKRRQIRKQICDILTDFAVTAYAKGSVEGNELYSTAGKIMELFSKPEKCVMHKILTPTSVMYFQCSKCDGVMYDIPDKYCPHCARRIIATEDMSLWL